MGAPWGRYNTYKVGPTGQRGCGPGAVQSTGPHRQSSPAATTRLSRPFYTWLGLFSFLGFGLGHLGVIISDLGEPGVNLGNTSDRGKYKYTCVDRLLGNPSCRCCWRPRCLPLMRARRLPRPRRGSCRPGCWDCTRGRPRSKWAPLKAIATNCCTHLLCEGQGRRSR